MHVEQSKEIKETCLSPKTRLSHLCDRSKTGFFLKKKAILVSYIVKKCCKQIVHFPTVIDTFLTVIVIFLTVIVIIL